MSRDSRTGRTPRLNRRLVSGSVTLLVLASGATASGLALRASPAVRSSPVATRSSPPDTCRSELTGVRATARPDYALDRFMGSYASASLGWTGGDGGDSVPLPSGQDIWLFDDSYLGTVVGEHRVGDVALIRNLIVWQRGRQLFTHYGRENGIPAELMNYRVPPRGLYWADDGIALGDHLFVSYREIEYPKVAKVLNFGRLRTVIAEFSLPSLDLEHVRTLNRRTGPEWGASIIREGGYVYFYGLDETGSKSLSEDSLYLARLPVKDMSAPLERFDGTGWSSSRPAAPLLSGVAPAVAVAHFHGVYILVTMYPWIASDEMVAYFSCSLSGPFGERAVVYRTLGANDVSPPYQTSGIPGVYTYGAAVHPELSKGDQLVVSFNVNTSDWSLLQKNVNIVRPRYLFLTVDLGPA